MASSQAIPPESWEDVRTYLASALRRLAETNLAAAEEVESIDAATAPDILVAHYRQMAVALRSATATPLVETEAEWEFRRKRETHEAFDRYIAERR
jgi:uncharacterized protein (DUF2236 family)